MLMNAVIYTFPADKVAEAKGMLTKLSAASLAEAGCTAFDVAQSLDDPNTLVLHEEWSDQAALDLHYKTAHFEEYGLNGIRKLATARVGHRCQPF